jgi:hypothetical protein
MSKSPDAALLALIATLEERAKKNGEKSIVKGVVGRLEQAGASQDLIGEISALRPKKAAAVKAAPKADPAPKVNGKANAEAPKAADPEASIVAS